MRNKRIRRYKTVRAPSGYHVTRAEELDSERIRIHFSSEPIFPMKIDAEIIDLQNDQATTKYIDQPKNIGIIADCLFSLKQNISRNLNKICPEHPNVKNTTALSITLLCGNTLEFKTVDDIKHFNYKCSCCNNYFIRFSDLPNNSETTRKIFPELKLNPVSHDPNPSTNKIF